MSDFDSGCEDQANEYADELLLPGEEVHPMKVGDIRGESLKILGFVMNTMDKMAVVESVSRDVVGPGTPIFFDDYQQLGVVLDVFGPVDRPLYVVKPEPTHEGMAGKAAYLYEGAISKESILEKSSGEGSSSEANSCDEGSEEGEL